MVYVVKTESCTHQSSSETRVPELVLFAKGGSLSILAPRSAWGMAAVQDGTPQRGRVAFGLMCVILVLIMLVRRGLVLYCC